MSDRLSVLIRGVELIAGVAGGWILGDTGISNWWLFVPGTGLVVALVWEWTRARKARYAEVEAQISAVVSILAFHPEDDVRCTVHVPVGLVRKRFRQVCSYQPQGGGAGRTFSLTKGIIWHAYEARTTCVENFANDMEYRAKMVERYNYSESEMRERTPDRRSYFCLPVSEADTVIGLVYFDARSPGVFPPEGHVQRGLVTERVGDLIRPTLLDA